MITIIIALGVLNLLIIILLIITIVKFKVRLIRLKDELIHTNKLKIVVENLQHENDLLRYNKKELESLYYKIINVKQLKTNVCKVQ